MRSPTQLASGVGAPRADAPRPWGFLRAGSLLARIRQSEYVTVGASPRFRAVQRRRTVSSSRVGFIIIAGAVIFDAMALYELQSGQGPLLVALNGTVVPRHRHAATPLAEGDEVEIVTAVQGG